MKEITTTNIRVERSKLMKLKRRALEENRSLSSLLRELIDHYLGACSWTADRQTLADSQRKAVTRWAGTSLGKGFSGRDHDRILYGGES